MPQRTLFTGWLALLLAGLAVFQAGAAWSSATLPTAAAAAHSLPPALSFIAGGVWALIFALGAVNLVRHGRGALTRALLTLWVFIIYSGARLLFFARADYDRERLPFLLIALALLSIIPAAHLLRRQRDGDTTHDPRSEDE